MMDEHVMNSLRYTRWACPDVLLEVTNLTRGNLAITRMVEDLRYSSGDPILRNRQ